MSMLRSHLGLTAMVLALGVFMAPPANAAISEEELKEIQNQVALLEQQIKLSSIQQTQASATQTSILTALKAQASAQSDLDKALAQGGFAKLAGIKAGLDSVGAPVGKDGTITVTAGTAGASMLSLRKPMLDGLEESATLIAKAFTDKSKAIYFGSDDQVQSAMQSEASKAAISQAITALDTSITETKSAAGGGRFKPLPLLRRLPPGWFSTRWWDWKSSFELTRAMPFSMRVTTRSTL